MVLEVGSGNICPGRHGDRRIPDDCADYYLSEMSDASDDDSGYGYASEEIANNNDRRTPKEYTVLKESDIRALQEADISYVSTVLSISRVESSILLRHYRWNVSRLHDEWFADEEKVRTTAGLLNIRSLGVVDDRSPKRGTKVCGICFESYSPVSMLSAAGCGHPFCIECWRGYVSAAISGGVGCLMLRCPEPSCKAAIGEDMIGRIASDQEKEKYSRFLVRSYIEDKKKIKWCPATDCEYAVEFDDLSMAVKDVTCLCSNTFCWNCQEEVHRPVDCSTVAKWVLKNSSESESVTWILAYTKPCPKCQRPIEKNHGCSHMTCRPPCRFEFCWMCLGPWEKHYSYACNRFGEEQGVIKDEDETRRERAKKSIDRYMHYFERWAGNQKSRLKALEDLQLMQNINLDKLIYSQKQTVAQLKFVVEAWQQIVECRRVLKWTYAYGYYLPACEDSKRQLFEYLQGQAELGLERLHSCAEKDLKVFLEDNNNNNHDKEAADFTCFRSKLVGLTSVTRNYFENLVRALENGLSDVDSSEAGPSTAASKLENLAWRGIYDNIKGPMTEPSK